MTFCFEIDRAYKTCNKVSVSNIFGRINICTDKVFEFCFVDFKVASYKWENELVVVLSSVNNGFANIFCCFSEKLCNVGNCFCVWRFFEFKFFNNGVVAVVKYAVRRFHICFVVTLGAYCNRVFANICQKHKFVRNRTAHHTRVAFNCDNFRHACSCKNSFVCFVATVIVFFKVFLRGVERVCVFHSELTHTDKSCS